MSQIQDNGRQIIRSNEKIADALYQRKSGAREMIGNVMKQLVLFTELLVQNSKVASDPQFPERMRQWNEKFMLLSKVSQEDDDVLLADVLHHEINAELEKWIA